MPINPQAFTAIPEPVEQAVRVAINNAPFPKFVGLDMEAVKKDYARMRLPYRPEMNQPAGIIHGGAIASLIDTTVVGAIFSGFDPGNLPKKIVTIDMHVHYIAAGVEQDLICHAAVRRRGRQIIFLETDVLDLAGKLIAHGELSYMVMA